MIVLGLTGSIGMGKTTAANMLRTLGLPVHDADAEVHALLSPGGAAVSDVAQAFPEAYDARSGGIDRHKLGLVVFANPGERRRLERILHPKVRAAQTSFLKNVRKHGADMAVLDVPLLFEYGVYRKCDCTICVNAPYFIQKMRVLARPGMTEEKFLRRLASQLPDAEKRRMADFVVQTGIGKAHTFRHLKCIVTSLRKGGRT
ncbi:MAG: dephospho-CoA kinase [Alphaproteobacteria bacterium]|nr:dephospho-CoA kinase [Alphaproteobacteria bacterium]